jgi:regulator of protease activity HflC (stomatin/prohibitin superfamily)
MLNFILGFVGLVAIVVWLVTGIIAPAESSAEVKNRMLKTAFVPVIGLVLFVLSMSIFQINAGEVGQIRRFGAVYGDRLDPGLHVKTPVADKVLHYNTRQLSYELSDNPNNSKANYTDFTVGTMTKDGQRIKVRFSLLFSIDPTKVGYIANNIGTEADLVEKIIKSNARSEGRNIPKGFSAQDLYSENVYDAQKALFDALSPIYAQNGIILHEVLLRDIGFEKDLAEALERKQIALEDAVTAERNIKIKDQEAKQVVATAEGARAAAIVAAQGEAQSVLIKAKANAEAIRLQRREINKQYIDYMLKKGISDGTSNVKVIVTDGSSRSILDLR